MNLFELRRGRSVNTVTYCCFSCGCFEQVEDKGVPGANTMAIEAKGWRWGNSGWHCKKCMDPF